MITGQALTFVLNQEVFSPILWKFIPMKSNAKRRNEQMVETSIE
jgi:hypothetical protein